MRTILQSSAMAIAAALIGGATLVSAPAFSASEPLVVAQADIERRGERGGGMRRGGAEMPVDRGRGGETRGRGPEMRSPQIRERGEVRDVQRNEMRVQRGARDEAQRSQPRVERQRVEQRRDFRRDDRRWDRRQDRRDDQRWNRRDVRVPFLYLGGPRIVVRGYGPGWCRGLHRGYHWAPRIGWHSGTHRHLYRC
jgi:hypothetical protein